MIDLLWLSGFDDGPPHRRHQMGLVAEFIRRIHVTGSLSYPRSHAEAFLPTLPHV